MIQNFKQNYLTWLGAASLMMSAPTMLGAQTVIWGAGSGIASQETQATFAATDSTFAGTNWVTSNNTIGLWKWSSNGRSRGANSIGLVNTGTGRWITSPSIANGAAIFDSDYFDGQAGVSHQAGSLTLGNIDLTGYTDSTLTLRFYTSYLDWETDTATVSFSTDGGATWLTTNVYPLGSGGGQRKSYNGWINVNITSAVAGVSNLTNCQVRFRFNGESYFWAVDDVNIIKAHPYDIAIAAPDPAGTTLGSAFSSVRVSGNYYQPLSQVSKDEYFFGARVVNKGARDLAGAKLFAKVEYNAGGSWTLQAFDSIVINQTLAANGASSIDTTALFSNDWLPSMAGEYRVTHFVQQTAGADAMTINDTAVHTFNITDSIAPYYSKTPLAQDMYPFVDAISFPAAAAGNRVSSFEYGSMFWFPEGGLMALDSVRFRLYRYTATPSTFTGEVVTVRLSKFRDLDGDGRLSDNPNSGELVLVGIGSDTIRSSAAGLIATTMVLSDVDNGTTPRLNDTTIYLVSIEQSNVAGLTSISGSNTVILGYGVATYSFNYAMNAGLIAPSPARIAEITSTGSVASDEWNWVGFGADSEPGIGLFLTDLRTIAVRELASNVSSFDLFPNPTNSTLNVSIALNETSTINYIMTDINGRIVRMATSKNVQSEVASFDVADLASGVYFISVRTEKGVSTKRFVKE